MHSYTEGTDGHDHRVWQLSAEQPVALAIPTKSNSLSTQATHCQEPKTLAVMDTQSCL